MRRFTRLTNAFSKKIENHACAIALHTMFYNFVRIHQTLKITPAMAAGATMRLWEMTDIVEMIEAWEGSRAQLTLQLCPLGERLQSSVHQIHSLLDNQLEFYYQGGRLPICGQQASPDVQNLELSGKQVFRLNQNDPPPVVETLGDAFAAGLAHYRPLRLGQARGHKDPARVPVHARTGPGDLGLDARAKLAAVELRCHVSALPITPCVGSVSTSNGFQVSKDVRQWTAAARALHGQLSLETGLRHAPVQMTPRDRPE